VQLGGSGHALGQRLLDVHVHILQLGFPGELSRLDFAQDLVEPRVDCVPLAPS
jgi:hypothetical protein